MKLVIASDIHGSAYWCGKLMAEIEREAPDTVVLLGDLLYHGPRNDLPRDYAPKQVLAMLNTLAGRVVAVRGNCDAEVDQMVLDFPMMADYVVIADGGFQMLCTHGHLPSPDRVPVPPQGGALLCGHTHVKMNEPLDVRMPDGSVVPTVRMLNPGSVSIPKDGSNSYAVYQDGEFELRDL